MSKHEHAYIGIKKCGCVVAAMADLPDHANDVAREVASFIKSGLTIERVSCEEVRVRLTGCKCEEEATTEKAESRQLKFDNAKEAP